MARKDERDLSWFDRHFKMANHKNATTKKKRKKLLSDLAGSCCTKQLK